MRAFIQLLIVLAAGFATAPACAELYKWVDARGVTNYSSEPPTDPKSAKKLTRVENTISVYTPDDALMQSVKALRERNNKTLSEPEPEPERQQVASLQSQSPYEQCLASGRPDCDTQYADYYPGYLPGFAVFRGRPVRPTRFVKSRARVEPHATFSRSGHASTGGRFPLR